MLFQKIALIGMGLLGGSLGLAAKQRGLAGSVAGFVRRQASISECLHYGVADLISTEIVPVVDQADLIILCTPIAQMRSLTVQMLPHVKSGAIITDVGSVKAIVTSEIEPLAAQGGAHFIGSHPMAGAEKMGVSAARAELFVRAWCVLTPTPRTNLEALARLENFWKEMGSRTMKLAPEVHDDLVSRSSHLPHIVAAGLANYVLNPAFAREQSMLCATGFRDTTRVASGSPEMWRDIALANRENLKRILGVFIDDLHEFQLALEAADEKAVMGFFQQAKHRRDAWCIQSISPD